MDEGFCPSSVIVRGFAPYGGPSSNKINDKECKKQQLKLLELLPSHIRGHLNPNFPFGVNHQISFRADGIGTEPRSWCEAAMRIWNSAFEAGTFSIGTAGRLKATLEISPERRMLCRNYYAACEWLLNEVQPDFKDAVTCCNKGLRIWEVGTNDLLGETPRGAVDWKWRKAGLEKLGVRVENIGSEHLFSEPAQMAD